VAWATAGAVCIGTGAWLATRLALAEAARREAITVDDFPPPQAGAG
jgi:2-keto-3-deoxy-6-phosphogluconate aldolase